MYVDLVLHHIEAEFVSFTQGDSRLDAAARHPHGERIRMMVAPVVPALHHRRAAEFPTPDNQRVLQHAALLQILHQSRARLVGVDAVLLDVLHQIAVLIPGFVEQLHVAHTALHQPASHQAVIREGRLAGLRAVHFQDVLRLLCQVHQFRSAGLHPERHLE